MKYIKQKTKNDSAKNLTRPVFLQSDADKQNEESDLLYLKHAVIKDQNPETIVQKLKSTRKLRDDMCAKLETDYREHFPFFFTNPELVSNFNKMQFIQILVNNSSNFVLITVCVFTVTV